MDYITERKNVLPGTLNDLMGQKNRVGAIVRGLRGFRDRIPA